MHDETKESTQHHHEGSSNQPPMNAAIGRFKDSANAEKAVKALKQAGFTDEAISVRDLDTGKQVNEKEQAESTTSTMVGVGAEGEKAAEAWSILKSVSKAIVEEESDGER